MARSDLIAQPINWEIGMLQDRVYFMEYYEGGGSRVERRVLNWIRLHCRSNIDIIMGSTIV